MENVKQQDFVDVNSVKPHLFEKDTRKKNIRIDPCRLKNNDLPHDIDDLPAIESVDS